MKLIVFVVKNNLIHLFIYSSIYAKPQTAQNSCACAISKKDLAKYFMQLVIYKYFENSILIMTKVDE